MESGNKTEARNRTSTKRRREKGVDGGVDWKACAQGWLAEGDAKSFRLHSRRKIEASRQCVAHQFGVRSRFFHLARVFSSWEERARGAMLDAGWAAISIESCGKISVDEVVYTRTLCFLNNPWSRGKRSIYPFHGNMYSESLKDGLEKGWTMVFDELSSQGILPRSRISLLSFGRSMDRADQILFVSSNRRVPSGDTDDILRRIRLNP